MQLTWNGTDITEHCNITGCIHREAAGGKSDSLELTLDRAALWYQWGPEEGDEIEIAESGHTTGRMYLTAVFPVRDQFRILANSIHPKANRKAWIGFQNMQFKTLVERCAAECGMSGKIFGMDESLIIPYALRKGEGCAAFLDRIARAEGFRIKVYNGAIRAIYLPYAESFEPSARITLTAKQDGVTYRRRKNLKYTSLTVLSPYAKATAKDTEAEGENPFVITTLPAMDKATAGRWARNLLREHNRQAEELTIEQQFNPAMSALYRVHVDGGTDMDGEWIIEETEHDLKNKTSLAKMYRIIDSIR